MTHIERGETAKFAGLVTLAADATPATDSDITSVVRTVTRDFSPYTVVSTGVVANTIEAVFGKYDSQDPRVKTRTEGYNFYDTATEFSEAGVYVVEYVVTETSGSISKLVFQVTAR